MKTNNHILKCLAIAAFFNIGIQSANASEYNLKTVETSVSVNYDSFSNLNFGFENTPVIKDTKTDINNNLYVTGSVVLEGYENAFLAKFNNEGVLLWKTVSGGSHYGNESHAVEVDNAGFSTIKGEFSAEAVFGNFRLEGARKSFFIAKFDAQGNCISAEKTGVDIE